MKSISKKLVITHMTIYRRPETNKHGDKRGRVWFHKHTFLERMFFISPKFIKTIPFESLK
ncbi:hypothetical protein MM5_050 [Morganella phage vB_Mm5]